jgi:hypothetical protein
VSRKKLGVEPVEENITKLKKLLVAYKTQKTYYLTLQKMSCPLLTNSENKMILNNKTYTTKLL